ncbi:uncharacterized protein LOC143245576 [Tachypleus tridentatus]|uniref:uncharacterized protein LOC143245576 n=1 Tax=Tachypleus tridentatus TaxID=6853 RepID=UPI003FCF4E9B
MADLSFTLFLIYTGISAFNVLATETQEHPSQGTFQNSPPLSTDLHPGEIVDPTTAILSHLLFDCTNRPDGAYPDYQKACRLFYLCESGRRHIFWCSNGTVFNPDSGHCDAPHRASCVDPEKSSWPTLVGDCGDQEDGIYTDYESECRKFYFCKAGEKLVFSCPGNKRFDWRTGSCREVLDVPCSKLSCEKKPDGIFTDYSENCKRYYLCRKEERTEYVCPPGKIFNERIMKCNGPKGVHCSNISSFNCNGLPDGYYPEYDNNCRAFYLCANSKLKSYSCPANLAFSKRLLACDYPSKARCEKPAETYCQSKPNGIYPLIETGCREFVICRDSHVTHLGACSQGKLMNPATWKCDPSPLVKCVSVKDPDCEDKTDGLYPDINTGCSAYFLCINHRRVVTKYCPSSSLFDVSTGSCLSSSLVHCHHPDNSPTLASYRHWDISQYGCEGRVGLFPDFVTECSRYYVCAYGRRELRNCPEGMKFNIVTRQCEDPSSVSCTAPQVLGAFRCLQGDEGIYVDVSSNCKRWHECWDNVGETYRCPAGRWFNAFTRSCDGSTDNQCENNGVESVRPYSFESRIIRVLQKTKTSFGCQAKRNGFYTLGEENCRLFHICANGQTFSYMCPEDLVYNPDSESCDDPIRVNCEQIKEQWTKSNDGFSCSSKTDGMYPDYLSRCKKYFICEKGLRKESFCPDDHMFNRITLFCELESDVICKPPLTEEYPGTLSLSVNPDDSVQFDVEENNSSISDQPLVINSSEDVKSINFTATQGAMRKTQKQNLTLSHSRNHTKEHQILNEDQRYGEKTSTEQIHIIQDADFKRTNNKFVNNGVTTQLPRRYEYLYYDIYDYPNLFNDHINNENKSGGNQTLIIKTDIRNVVTKKTDGKSQNEDIKLVNKEHENIQKKVIEKNPIDQTNETKKTNDQNLKSELTAHIPKEYEYYYYAIYDYPDFEDHKKDIGKNVDQDQSFSLSANNHQADMKKGVHLTGENINSTQNVITYDHFDDYDISESSITNEKKKIQTVNELVITTVLPVSVTSSATLEKPSEYERETLEPVGLILTTETNNAVLNVENERNSVEEQYLSSDLANETSSLVLRFANETNSLVLGEERERGRMVLAHENERNILVAGLDNKTYSLVSGFPNNSSNLALNNSNKTNSLMSTLETNTGSLVLNDENETNSLELELVNNTNLKPKYNSYGVELQQGASSSTDTLFVDGHESDQSPIEAKPETINPTKLSLSDIAITESTLSTNFGFKCPYKEIGFFPDYESGCKQFHICYRNIRKTYSCPSVLLFNPESKNCDLPENVFCQSPEISKEGKLHCEGKINGYYPDYKAGCRKYYACLKDQVLVYTCPTGKLFNVRTMACDLAEAVTCTDSGKQTIDIKVQSTGNDVVDKVSKSTHVHGVPHRFLFDCSDKPDGFYPDYARFCHVFYRCKDGMKISHYCKQGFLFNSELGMCDFEENVKCNFTVSESSTTKL